MSERIKLALEEVFSSKLTWVNHYAKLFTLSSLVLISGKVYSASVCRPRLLESSSKVNNMQPTANCEQVKQINKANIKFIKRKSSSEKVLYMCSTRDRPFLWHFSIDSMHKYKLVTVWNTVDWPTGKASH